MTKKIKIIAHLAALFLVGCGGQMAVAPSQAASQDITGITQALIELLNKKEGTKITADDYESTSMRQLISSARRPATGLSSAT
jgi:PBP1b-binding outer membrane lipoprotein LpoB